jgi:2-keto-4-pentenoate hydratase/2-oxohepta-3-ene-1,7-dioic acid hydratase in catechol pathway
MSDILSVDMVEDPMDLGLDLRINGELKQVGNTGDMIFSIKQQIEDLSKFMTLNEGDMILSGTPDGASFVKPGDKIECSLK